MDFSHIYSFLTFSAPLFKPPFHIRKQKWPSYPVQGLLEAVEPVLAGQGVLCEVHGVGDVRGRVLQQRQIHQLPLQTVHLQHVELDKTETVMMHSVFHSAPT